MTVQRPWYKRFGYDLIRIAARLFGLLYFRIRVRGRSYFPLEGGGLVCSNHQSFLDPVLVGLACDRRLNYLARDTLFVHPLLGGLIDYLDAIPIDREGMGLGGLKETLRRLKKGELVLIFPEGTRTEDGRLAPLKPGFCALVRRGKVPLIPVGIEGAYASWPRGRKLPWPHPVRVVVGPPISAELAATLSDQDLMDEVARRIAQCLADRGPARESSLPRKVAVTQSGG